MRRGDGTEARAGHIGVIIVKTEEQDGGAVLRDRRGLRVDRAPRHRSIFGGSEHLHA